MPDTVAQYYEDYGHPMGPTTEFVRSNDGNGGGAEGRENVPHTVNISL
jgi:hypothetical protein